MKAMRISASTNFKLVFISLIVITITLYTSYHHKLHRNSSASPGMATRPNAVVNRSTPYATVTMLYWTKPRHWSTSATNMDPCNEELLDTTWCVFTTNRSWLETADALIFRGMDTRNVEEFAFPPFRSPDQIWVYLDVEPPGRYYQQNDILKNIFNWTMTYRSSSDVPYYYGSIVARQMPWSEAEFDAYFNTVIRKKRKLLSWLVSNCNAPSQRNHIVAYLRRLIPVDVYGGCGTLKCEEAPKVLKCFTTLADQYKFYLALENRICYDYVSEKTFNSLRKNIVPIVYSGANLSLSLPPNSYIDILSYDNLTALVDYLHELDQNDVLYKEYFVWKRYYEIGKRDPNGWCELCKKLKAQRQNPEHKTYEDVAQFVNQYEGDKRRAPKFLQRYLKEMLPKLPVCNLFES